MSDTVLAVGVLVLGFLSVFVTVRVSEWLTDRGE